MLFLQPVRLAADRPHVWVSGADWSWDFLWPKAAAWSGFSVTTKSAWKQISTQVAPTARTCQWGMLDASGKTKPVKRVPLLCPSLVYSVHSFPLFFPFLSFSSRGQQVHSLSTPGEKQIPEEECNKALSLSLSVCPSLSLSECVCAVAGRWAVLQSLPNKLVYTHTEWKQTVLINLWEIQAVQTLDSSRLVLGSYWTAWMTHYVQNLTLSIPQIQPVATSWKLSLFSQFDEVQSKEVWHSFSIFLENST